MNSQICRMIRRSLTCRLFALIVLLGGCAGSGSRSHIRTKYHRGDFVVYQYSGTFSPQPVALREEILSVRGLRLEISVRATRGSEERHWVQIVTDTIENQRSNIVDELYVVEGNGRTRLANRDNADLYRLYDWTYVVPEGKNSDVHLRQETAELGNKPFHCNVESGRNVVKGEAIRYELFECPDFLWQHGRGRFWKEGAGQDIWRVEVVAFGNRDSAE